MVRSAQWEIVSLLFIATGTAAASEFAEFLKKERANAERVFKAIGVQPTDAPS